MGHVCRVAGDAAIQFASMKSAGTSSTRSYSNACGEINTMARTIAEERSSNLVSLRQIRAARKIAIIAVMA